MTIENLELANDLRKEIKTLEAELGTYNTKKQIPQYIKNAVISCSGFLNEYYSQPTQEEIDKTERAFQALLAYEKNCIAKYDYLDNRPSKPPIKGERMSDYAERYGTTIKEMKSHWKCVKYALANGL